MSGPHDFAVRDRPSSPKGFAGQRRRSSFGAFASTASRPTFVTMADAPLDEAGRREFIEMICPTGETKYFCGQNWTVDSALIAFCKFDFSRSLIWRFRLVSRTRRGMK
jgi:hypothetical protein